MPIWVDFMRAMLPPPTNAPHVPPAGVVEAMIDPATGARLPPGSSGGVREYFDETKSPADASGMNNTPIPVQQVPQHLLNDLF